MLRIDNPGPQGSSYASAGHLRFGAIGTDAIKTIGSALRARVTSIRTVKVDPLLMIKLALTLLMGLRASSGIAGLGTCFP